MTSGMFDGLFEGILVIGVIIGFFLCVVVGALVWLAWFVFTHLSVAWS